MQNTVPCTYGRGSHICPAWANEMAYRCNDSKNDGEAAAKSPTDTSTPLRFALDLSL